VRIWLGAHAPRCLKMDVTANTSWAQCGPYDIGKMGRVRFFRIRYAQNSVLRISRNSNQGTFKRIRLRRNRCCDTEDECADEDEMSKAIL